MTIVHKAYHIKASIDEVWKALVDPTYIKAWSKEEAIMGDQKGDPFKLWGGDIFGKNIEVKPKEKLVQEWYGGKWEKPSIVTFTLTQEEGETKITLMHEDIPVSEVASIDSGWDEYYLGPMKKLLEAARN